MLNADTSEKGFDFRQILLQLPKDIGTCERVFDPKTGKGIIHVKNITVFNEEINQSVYECLNWLTTYYSINFFGSDGLSYPSILFLDGENILQSNQLGAPLYPYYKNESAYPFGFEKFLYSGKLKGTFFGLDSPRDYEAQWKATKQLTRIQPQILPSLNNLIYKIANSLLRTLPKEFEVALSFLLDEETEEMFNPLSFYKTINESDLEIDFSRLSFYGFLHKNIYSMAMFLQNQEKSIVSIRSEINQFLRENSNRIPEVEFNMLMEELKDIFAYEKEVEFLMGENISHLLIEIESLALRFGIQMGSYQNINNAIQGIEIFKSLFEKFHDVNNDLWNIIQSYFEKGKVLFEEVQLIEDLKILVLLNDMVSLKAQPNDVKDFFLLGITRDFLKERINHYNIDLFDNIIWEDAIKNAKEFYIRAKKRGRIIGRNVMQLFEYFSEQNESIFLLINTGFLTEFVESEIDGDRLALYSVTPNIKYKAQKNDYKAFYNYIINFLSFE